MQRGIRWDEGMLLTSSEEAVKDRKESKYEGKFKRRVSSRDPDNEENVRRGEALF